MQRTTLSTLCLMIAVCWPTQRSLGHQTLAEPTSTVAAQNPRRNPQRNAAILAALRNEIAISAEDDQLAYTSAVQRSAEPTIERVQWVARRLRRSPGRFSNRGEGRDQSPPNPFRANQSDSMEEGLDNQPTQPTPDIPTPKGVRADSAVVPSPVGVEEIKPLTTQQKRLRAKVRRVLAHYYKRPFNTRNRGPWELMHALLSFEVHSKVLQGGPNGDPITVAGWLCFNQPCKRRTLMYINDQDKLRVRVGPGLQGHHGQLLAMLAQARISSNYPMVVEGQQLTIADLIKMEQETCLPRTELTFKLIGLTHYLDSDARWISEQGESWDFSRLIREEIRQPVRGAACGGTHRLSGLTLAYKARERRGEPVDGEYLRAKKFVERYQKYAYRLQNPDGSFSTEWFRGPGDEEDVERRLKTTGHLLEWLLYAATERELNHWRTSKAVNYLANIMYNNRFMDWEAGPLGHAIHSLVLYDRLVFAPHDSPSATPIARKHQRSAAQKTIR